MVWVPGQPGLYRGKNKTKQNKKIFSTSAGVVIIDDHPEVTVIEDPQSNLNDDGFTEVVSKKQQKRLQDEERRKKEEQVVQVWAQHFIASFVCWYPELVNKWSGYSGLLSLRRWLSSFTPDLKQLILKWATTIACYCPYNRP
jgi:hypothetical protein